MRRESYAGHKLEDGHLCHLKQVHDFDQALDHGSVVTNGSRHTASKIIPKGVFNVQLTGRTRRQEGVVEAYFN